MAFAKAVGFAAVLFVLCYDFGQLGCCQTLSFTPEETPAGQSQPHNRGKRSTLLPFITIIEVDINVSDMVLLRAYLSATNFPLQINNATEIDRIDVTTVCQPNATGYQCQCEEQYRWPCDKCTLYGTCDEIANDTCRCIDGMPLDGIYCQAVNQTNFTACPQEKTSTTVSSVLYEYLVDIDVNTTGLNVINQLRSFLKNVSYPETITDRIELTEINLSTVCYPNTTGFQCRCEDQYRWPCDKCLLYGSCDAVTNDTCGCIDAIPADGQYCQSVDQQNFTKCPTPAPFIPPVRYEYLIEIEVNTTDVTVIDRIRNVLGNTFYFVGFSIHLTEINVSTVCYPYFTGFQCRCEDQYRWPCDKCLLYGSCYSVTNDTCGCINAIPTDGQYCQSVDQRKQPTDFTKCPTPAPFIPPESMRFNFSMDLTFNASFENNSSTIYQEIDQAIRSNYKKSVKNFLSAVLIRFRSGSVIAEYNVTATFFGNGEIANAQSGIFNEIGAKFNIITESTTFLTFTPQSPFSGDKIELVCGPPPTNLSFTSSMKAEWKVNGNVISPDKRYTFSQDNTIATLTVNLPEDNATYDCTLRDTRVFHQKSGNIRVPPAPNIILTPIQAYASCSNGATATAPVQVDLQCCVQPPHKVRLMDGNQTIGGSISNLDSTCMNYKGSISNCGGLSKTFTCQEAVNPRFKKTAMFDLSTTPFICLNDAEFGSGPIGGLAIAPCKMDEVGNKTAMCLPNGTWSRQSDNCVLQILSDLFGQSQFLDNVTLPAFLLSLSNATQKLTDRVVSSPSNIDVVVNILENVATVSKSIIINKENMENILLTVDVLTSDNARQSWINLNTGHNVSVSDSTRDSSRLLGTVENISDNLSSDSFSINTSRILLNKTTFGNEFIADLNNSVVIDLLTLGSTLNSITTILFLSFDNVLPVRDSRNLSQSDNVINGNIVLVKSNAVVNNVSFTFDIVNKTLGNPQCVFWNFSLLQGLGGWDNRGCVLQNNLNNTVNCNCNHLTSFSILMSPNSNSPPLLDYITYVGVGISMVSLIICLIIEAVVWKKVCNNTTSHMRHVAIVNIAVSLLAADIWFIVGAAINNKGSHACVATAFFIHFFYLCLFFWMLFSALLLLNGTINVFSQMAKSTMMAIGFCLGYAAPLVIVVITIAVTEPRHRYLRSDGACWLNWDESKALLAFVIPALTIVFINFLIMIVVVIKILRSRGLRAQAEERHALVVIGKCLAVLTPLFGLTWGLGVGVVIEPANLGIAAAFAFFNSLQGFFILVFGTLLDKKVRQNLRITPPDSRGGTRSTTEGTSSGTGGFLQNLKRRVRGGYNISTPPNSSAGSAGHLLNT